MDRQTNGPTDQPTDRQTDLYYPQFADKKFKSWEADTYGFYCIIKVVIPTYYLVVIKIFPPRKTWGLQYSHVIQGNSETLTEMCETFKLYWRESSVI